MRKPFLGGNWKLNGDHAFVEALLGALCREEDSAVDTVIFPAYPYLSLAHQLLQNQALQLGAQNCCQYPQGAYTGEVSASMLKDVGCTWVLLGHSERRHLYAETDAMLKMKIAEADAQKLGVVFCVGETEAERERGETDVVIERQLSVLVGQLSPNLVIAYEPVWAIGTGKTPTAAEIQTTHQKIRQFINSHDPMLAKSLRILYGGSLKLENAQAIFALPDVDGGLIGGASLEAASFLGLRKLLRTRVILSS